MNILSRCQFLLQQGQFVADVCYLSPEGSPYRFHAPATPGSPPHRPAYNFDGCTPEVVLTRMKVKDGRLVLPDGMSYRVLVLPEVETMTPKLLRKVSELVKAGATVVGPAPLRSPGLSDYPKCEEEVHALARELWSGGAGEGAAAFGRGRVIWPLESEAGSGRGGSASPAGFGEVDLVPGRPSRVIRAGGQTLLPPHLQCESGSEIESARLVMTADNEFEAWVNGRRAGGGDDFTTPTSWIARACSCRGRIS